MLISCDSHVVEPGNLWLERLPAKYRDRAPRAVKDPVNHHEYFGGPGLPRGVDLTLSRNAGMTAQEVNAILEQDPDAWVGAMGGHDPVQRLADLWFDDTVADVVYPTAGLSLLQYDDPEFQFACIQVYNDWLAEFCAVDPDRLIGLAMIPTWDMERGVAELERANDLGLRGGIMWTSPPEGRTYSFFSDYYDGLWRTAAERRMPISMHILAGHGTKGVSEYGKTLEGTFYFGMTSRDEVARTVADLIISGTFERFPDLRIVSAEAGIDYVARLERRLDSTMKMWWEKLEHPLKEMPSAYFRRNVYCTFISDPVGLKLLEFTGADHFMWSSDYPHGAATWPDSPATLAAEFDAYGVSEEDRRKLTLTNVADLYRIDLDVVAQPSPAIADRLATAG
jgi:predicted TIM-barrel fold metal-dependent hydrolase